MRTDYVRWCVFSTVLSLWLVSVGGGQAQSASPNLPPRVVIEWPRPNMAFSSSTAVKIKASASDTDGSIAYVQFFADTNLIGTATNLPFNTLWYVEENGEPYSTWRLKAVAVDSHGASTESTPVLVQYYTGGPPRPVLEIISPPPRAVFSAPATFEFAAELLASAGDNGPVEFLIGTNTVGLVDQAGGFEATTPPHSMIVSNLSEGEYKLHVCYRGLNGDCYTRNRDTNTIYVVKVGVRSAHITSGGSFQFEVVTSFPNVETIAQSPGLAPD